MHLLFQSFKESLLLGNKLCTYLSCRKCWVLQLIGNSCIIRQVTAKTYHKYKMHLLIMICNMKHIELSIMSLIDRKRYPITINTKVDVSVCVCVCVWVCVCVCVCMCVYVCVDCKLMLWGKIMHYFVAWCYVGRR